jgi:hypothetical protein
MELDVPRKKKHVLDSTLDVVRKVGKPEEQKATSEVWNKQPESLRSYGKLPDKNIKKISSSSVSVLENEKHLYPERLVKAQPSIP